LLVPIGICGPTLLPGAEPETRSDILNGLRTFYAKTARPDGSFQPGIDPEYRGMSDSAYSDLAAVTYAVTIHKTFGWRLPFEDKTIAWLLGRQKPSGEFVNVVGTVKPDSAEGRTYNTTQALVALRALGVKPIYDPLPIFDDVLKADYKDLPPYTTSFFPLAYLCAGKPIPEKADRGVRALMIQDRTGYLNDHIAATFHASHYYHLVGEPTPKATAMVARILADQAADGSWLLNKPSRDRHATFDAVFTLHHEGHDRKDCRDAIQRAARWALSCRNPDGGFGHFPGSPSDADAVYFQVGTLVMAGLLKPVDPLPPDPHLLSWGHLMPVRRTGHGREVFSSDLGDWIGAIGFSKDDTIVAAAGNVVRCFDIVKGRERFRCDAGARVAALDVSPGGDWIVTGGYDGRAVIWDGQTGERRRMLDGHRGAVLAVAIQPGGSSLATGGVDASIVHWDGMTGKRLKQWRGHRSWVNTLTFSADGRMLASGSSDGTIRIRHLDDSTPERVLNATDAEVRCIAISKDGRWLAAGIRYGGIKVWDTSTWKEHLNFKGHEGDVWAIAFAPDSGSLFSSNGDWNRPGHVKRWDVATGKQRDSFQCTGEVLSVALSRDGRYLTAGGGDHALQVWDLTKPKAAVP
jgi:geranylgeranyl transferase type-2 subunit beta